MKKHPMLVVAFSGSLFLSQPGAHAEPLEGDAIHKDQAIALAKDQNKQVFLVVSDTNGCSDCISLEYTILPSTSVSNFLRESFIYWPCGPNQNCTEYTSITGTGTLPAPAYYVFDPYKPLPYLGMGSGAGGANNVYTWLSRTLLQGTAPRITNLVVGAMNRTPQPTNNQTLEVASTNIVVQGRSISTNVPIRTLKYSLNGGTWSSLIVSNSLEWSLNLTLPRATNDLRVYAIEKSGTYKSRTNAMRLIYDPNAVITETITTVTRTQGDNPSTYGTPLTFRATVNPDPGNDSVITFKVGGNRIGSSKTTNGVADLTIRTLPYSGGTNYSVTAHFAENANYAASEGSLSGGQRVNRASLSIKPANITKIYGQVYTFAGTEFTTDPEDLYNDDTVTSVSLTSDGATAGAKVGTYAILATNAQPTILTNNYEITYTTNGVLTVKVVVPGDTNGDGRVDRDELRVVLDAYLSNPANFPNSSPIELNFTLEYATDLPTTNWQELTPPVPVYFIDPAAATAPQRYYRVRLNK